MQGARIGPNALTQLLDPIEQHCGRDVLDRLLGAAGIDTLPDMTGLIDEDPVVRLHHKVLHDLPELAAILSREAGMRTGLYIIENRIPGFAKRLLRWLPLSLSQRLLAKAIAKNAWTFAGSGRFEVQQYAPLVFTLEANPFAHGLHLHDPGCHWHAAVFETLFRRLVSEDIHVLETSCCAAGDACCTFRVV